MSRVGQRRRGVWGSGPGSLVVALAVAVGSAVPAQAGARRPALVLGSSGEPASTEDIGELWQQAQARMDTADYDEAIALLTRVYDAIAQDPEAQALRRRVQWALHRAHRGAHGVDGQVQHLYVARDLLRKYREGLPPGEVEREAEAAAAMAEVEALIAEQQAARPEPEPEPEPVTEPEPEPEPVVRPEPEPEPARPDASAVDRALIIGGAVTAGLGLVGLGMMAGGLGSANAAVGRFETQPEQRAQARRDIQRGNTIAVAGGAAGGALLVAGAVVLGLGLRRRAQGRSQLAAGPGQAGLAWRRSF